MSPKNFHLFKLFLLLLSGTFFSTVHSQSVSKKTESEIFLEKRNSFAHDQDLSGKKTSTRKINGAIDISLCKKDAFTCPIVEKHFTPEKLKEIQFNNPQRLQLIEYYFHQSFYFELIENMYVKQEIINNFVINFDPAHFETQREMKERKKIIFAEAGIRVIFLARNELPQEMQLYITKFLLKDNNGGRSIPMASEK